MPELDPMPPAPQDSGLARVVIATDVPARVERQERSYSPYVAARSRSVAAYRGELLCEETPCAVSLPYGDHELTFIGTRDPARISATVVHVRSANVVVNHTLGEQRAGSTQGAGIVLAGIGTVIMAVGFGMAKADFDHDHRRTFGSNPDHVAVVGVGLGMMSFGGILGLASVGRSQDGATTQWTPPSPGPTPGVSLGLKF